MGEDVYEREAATSPQNNTSAVTLQFGRTLISARGCSFARIKCAERQTKSGLEVAKQINRELSLEYRDERVSQKHNARHERDQMRNTIYGSYFERGGCFLFAIFLYEKGGHTRKCRPPIWRISHDSVCSALQLYHRYYPNEYEEKKLALPEILGTGFL